MIHLPQRTSLVHETVNTLKQWVAGGLLKDILPGELDLKERLRVGRDTLRLALEILENEGWIEPSGQGRKRRIHAEKLSELKQTADDGLPVSFLSPYPMDQGQTQIEMEDTQKRLVEMGRELQHISADIFRLKDPDRQLEELVHSHPSAAWIIYATSQPVQEWFARRGLPTIIHGWPYPGVDLPYVTKNWEPAGFHAALQFIRQGHRTLGMFEFVERGAGAMRIDHGIRRAIESTHCGAKLLIFKDERTPESIARAYETAFKLKEPPTAMILTSSNHLLTSYSWLVSKGIRVPADVSLTVLPNDTWYSDLYPPLSHYKPNTKLFSQGMADRVLELIKFGRVIRKPLEAPVEYVRGATIGPAPQKPVRRRP